MIPRTFPSSVASNGSTQMIVYFLPSVSGMTRWVDYIPVKFTTVATAATENTYDQNGYIPVVSISSITGATPFKEYVPVFLDSSAADAEVWKVNITGFIPVGTAGIGGIISSLFTAGEQGWVYDPSDFNRYMQLGQLSTATMFQDAAGTTPVTAMEQPLGLQLDLRNGLPVLGTELVTNGDFSSGTTGWVVGTSNAGNTTLSVASGQLVVTALTYDGNANWAQQTFQTVAGKTYRASVDITASSGATSRLIRVGGGSITTSSGIIAGVSAVVGTNAFVFTATAATTNIAVGGVFPSGGSLTTDNISVRELPGNHRYQTTSANRPVVSARVNLLTKTEQFDDAAWFKTATTVTANSTAAPDGTLTADTIVETLSTSSHVIGISATVGATAHVFSVDFKKGLGATAPDWIQLYTGGVSLQYANFNLATGSVGNVAAGSTATITPTGNGEYRCTLTFTPASAGSVAAVIAFTNNTDTTTRGLSYAGAVTSDVFVWGADLRPANQGIGLPAYQRVNTSTDYDTAGFPIYIKANGSNQFMVSNAIDFTATDKMTVWAGVRKLSDATVGMLFELSSTIVGNNGAFVMLPTRSTAGTMAFSSKGSAIAEALTATTYLAPVTSVMTGLADISGDSAILRVNGTQAAINTADQGTGNYGNYPVYHYMRAGISLQFNGHDYGSICRGAASSAAQITAAEGWINQRTKAF